MKDLQSRIQHFNKDDEDLNLVRYNLFYFNSLNLVLNMVISYNVRACRPWLNVSNFLRCFVLDCGRRLHQSCQTTRYLWLGVWVTNSKWERNVWDISPRWTTGYKPENFGLTTCHESLLPYIKISACLCLFLPLLFSFSVSIFKHLSCHTLKFKFL